MTEPHPTLIMMMFDDNDDDNNDNEEEVIMSWETAEANLVKRLS
jgi:hypothetical protein